MKYQFCIRFDNIDVNSAASKAVLDCNRIFSALGYKDYTFTVGDNSNKVSYYFFLLKELITFFFGVKRGSIVGIQYPLLSINNVFKHFIKIAKFKGINFFCVVHDLESLRTGGTDQQQINIEISNLNFYDAIIVHNNYMKEWLSQAGITKKMISLELFDYLSNDFIVSSNNASESIVYAGNLKKSTFIYALPKIAGKQFAVYGPGFKESNLNGSNVKWQGEFSPEVIPQKLKGSFGLIWDGSRVDTCDNILGNYLRYNNPHKCSLYIAAGLPVIVPQQSAVGQFVKQHNIGLLIDSLNDIDELAFDEASYTLMQSNVLKIRQEVITGQYLKNAIKSAEALIAN